MRPFRHIPDSFAKVLIVRDDINTYKNDDGILIVSLETFLCDQSFMMNSLDVDVGNTVLPKTLVYFVN